MWGMLPVWLNLLLSVSSFLIILSLGSLILNLKIRPQHWILIALFIFTVYVGLEQWLAQSLIKTIAPVFVMVGLYSYLSKTNLYKSALAVIMGCNIYFFNVFVSSRSYPQSFKNSVSADSR